jgi:phenylacetate-coenzyme A ligase PaaK-like adenylate-forming protein
LHFRGLEYIGRVLATFEQLHSEHAQPKRLGELLPRWRNVPLYASRLAGIESPADLSRLDFISKRDMREGFPHNFLPLTPSLDDLIATREIELEYTSGTSEERLPVVFGRNWWNEQEQRALRLNRVVARVLDEFPAARRGTPPSGRPAPTARSAPACS